MPQRDAYAHAMASTDTTDSGHEDPVFAALLAAYEETAAAIEAMPDPAHGFSQATKLRDLVDQLVGRAAELRALMAGKVWEAEELSLAALATRIGVSKGRADQFIRAAKAAKAADQPREQ